MARQEIQKLILAEIQEIKQDLKEVRQNDIPNINTKIAVVQTESKTAAKIITGIGGAITLAVSVAAAWLTK